MHIGGYRTALFSWLYARHTGGSFILRIEDTDVARTVEGAVDYLIDGLHWLGMDFDEGPIVGGQLGPYYQTQRKALYQQYAHQLIASGHAYRCYCTPARLEQMRKEQLAQKLPPRYDRRCRYLSDEERAANDAAGLTWVVRFAMPIDGETVVHDELHGDITYNIINENGTDTINFLLRIIRSEITEIIEETFRNSKFENIYIEYNENLSRIDSNAFKASQNI